MPSIRVLLSIQVLSNMLQLRVVLALDSFLVILRGDPEFRENS